MTRRLRRADQAIADVIDIVDYLEDFDPRLRARFVAAVDDTANMLLATPNVVHRQHFTDDIQHSDVRIVPVHGRSFRNYLVFYRADAEEVHILRILFGRRDIPTLLEAEGDG